MPSSRQLVAIMFTDIQGYTSLMQKNEELAIICRDKHRQIFNSTTEKYNGSILQYFGDGTLSTFKSAIEAVQCAMEMQKEFRKEPCIPVRVGIHIGDIIVREDEVIGDGVNIASRIESLAVPGSVFISGKVFDEIRNQSAIQTQTLGIFDLKNVDIPIEVYAISNEGLIIPASNEITGKLKTESGNLPSKGEEKKPLKRNKLISRVWQLALLVLLLLAGYLIYAYMLGEDEDISLDQKSIAVLPFTNMTNDPSQDYFSDGITEEILTHLSKIADLRVVSRTSVMQYKNTTKTIPEIGNELGVSNILEGSVRKYGNKVRITAQLIEAESDKHVWAENYDRDITSIFDIQTEVAKEILHVLEAKLTRAEEESLDKLITTDISAYDYYLRGTEALNKGETLKNYRHAASFFREAIKEDPDFAAAYVGLAWALTFTGTYGASEELWKDSSNALNQKALSLDPELAEAWFFKGIYSIWEGDTEKAMKMFEKTLEYNPNHSMAKIELGELLLQQEKYDEGLDLIIHGWLAALNRKDPKFYKEMGDVYANINEYDKAELYYSEAISLNPDFYGAYYSLLDMSLTQGDYMQAIIYAEKLVEVEKNAFSLDMLSWAYMLNGNYTKAAQTWEEMGKMISEFQDEYFKIPYKHRIAYCLAKVGEKEMADLLFDEQIQYSKALLDSNAERHVTGQAYDLAGIYSFLGDEEQAFHYLRLSDEMGFMIVTLIDRDPLFDNIRQSEEFNRIVDKYRANSEKLEPKFETARKRIRELEEKGILKL